VSKKKPKGTGLTFIPINDPTLIPEYLVEQIRGRDYTVARFFEFAPKFISDQNTLVAVFADSDRIVKGLLIASVNHLSEYFNVNVLSIDKEYQKGTIVSEARNICSKYISEMGLKGLRMTTTRPKAMEKHGFKRTKDVVMVI